MVHQNSLRQLPRWSLAAVVFLLLMYWSFFVASLTGWSVVPAGRQRLLESLQPLAISTAIGIAALGGSRIIIGRRFLSPWLLLALLTPAYMALELVGVTR